MIRTRDFLVFAGAFVFLVTGIGMTIAAQSWSAAGEPAAVIGFDAANVAFVEGAAAEDGPDVPRESNIARLRQKIAAGAGDIAAGGPVFTSVDDAAAAAPVVTDSTPPQSVLIGHTIDGQPLLSDELWRFSGFGQFEQVGVSLNNFPIYGARADNALLDPCGGLDEGSGYRYHLQPDAAVDPDCFTS